MPSPTLVRFGSFSPSLPHLIAMGQGYYQERGLHVEQHRIPSSPALREALRADDLDVVLTSPDNIANYRLNGSARAHLDARIISGVDGGRSVSLMGRPGLSDLGDIRGGRVAVGRAQLEEILNLRRRWGGFDHDVDISAEVQRPRGLVDRRFAPQR